VKFVDDNGKTLKENQVVHEGNDALPPVIPSKDGYVFLGWQPSYLNVT